MKVDQKSYLKVAHGFYFPIDDEFVDSDLVVEVDELPYVSVGEIGVRPCSGPMVYDSGQNQLIDCEGCGFIHSIPLPSDEELRVFYTSKFYNQARKKDYFENQRSQLKWWNFVFDRRLERLERVLGRKGFILDVGCGPGFFLSRARELGWGVLGIEPSADAAEYATQELALPVKLGDISSLTRGEVEQTVDVVYSHGVVEHLRNPLSYLTKVRSLLGGGGLIFTSAANDFNPYQLAAVLSLDTDPWWIIPPEHLNYFSVASLKKLHERSGFELLHLETSFPIDQFLLMGEDYISNPHIGAKCHSMRTQFELTMHSVGLGPLLIKLAESFGRLGLGRQVDLIGKLK